MVDFIVIAGLAVIVGGAIAYIVKEKKRGVKCIGCPAAEGCAQASGCNCGGGCHGCHTDAEE